MGKRAGGGAAAAASASSGAGLEPAAGRGGGPRSAAAGLLGALHLVMTLVVAAARAEKEAFIQSESIIEVLRFDDGGLLQVILLRRGLVLFTSVAALPQVQRVSVGGQCMA